MKLVVTSIAAAFVVAAMVAAAGAQANGSPYSPGLVQGSDGVHTSTAPVRYVALGTGRSTIVAAIRVRGGRVMRSRILRGIWGIPIVTYDGSTGGISGDGRTLVVASYGPLPGEPGTTSFTVLAAKSFRKLRTVKLEGAWSYDAISPDGSRLYLIEHLSAGPNPRYRVRVFDLRAGRLLSQSVIDKAASEAIMRGQPATRASSADGRWAYTLYARQKHAPFVHALDTARRQAYCIDLPLDLGQPQQMALRLKLGAGGRELIVRKGGTRVATMNTETFVVRAEES